MSNTRRLQGQIGHDIASPTSDGHFVSDRVQSLIEIIHDFDPAIEVQWVPPDQRAADDPAFRLIDNSPDREAYIMFYVRDEAAFDEGVLERIFQSDQRRNPLSLTALDAANAAAKAVTLKKQMDEMDDAHDLAATILRSPLHTFRHNGVKYE